MPRVVDEAGVVYPTSDGKPMAESDTHRDLMVELIETLKGYFAGRDAYVSGNLLVYYEQGNPRKVLSPDCFVALGLRQENRPLFLTWAEGKFPDVVFEVTSKTTAREDQRKKRAVYQDVWRVREYFLFDPLGDYLTPTLQGYRLVEDAFVPIEPRAGRVDSALLGVSLEGRGDELHVFETATGRRLFRPEVQEMLNERAARERAEARLAEDLAARERAEAEVARLRAELAALRQPPPS